MPYVPPGSVSPSGRASGIGAALAPPGYQPRPIPGYHPYALPQYLFRPQVRPNSFCVASLVLGIVGIACFILYAVPCVLAIAFGAIGIRQVKRSDGEQSGSGFGIAGIVLGIVGASLMAIVLALLAGSWHIGRLN